MGRRSWRRLVAGLIVVAIVAAIVFSARSLRQCIADAHGGSSDILSSLVADGACLETYLRERAAVLIAIFIIILGLSTWFLWFAVRDLVAGIEQNSRSELRAYMTFHSGTMTVDRDSVRIEAVFVNSGKTPAYNVHSVDNCDLLPKDARLRPVAEPASLADTCVVGPGQPFHVGRTKPCAEPTARSVESGQATAYFWGRLSYTDCFGQSGNGSL